MHWVGEVHMWAASARVTKCGGGNDERQHGWEAGRDRGGQGHTGVRLWGAGKGSIYGLTSSLAAFSAASRRAFSAAAFSAAAFSAAAFSLLA